MKILLVAKAFPPITGGIETYSEEVAKAYLAKGHDVTVVTAHSGPTGLENRDGLAVWNVGGTSQPAVLFGMIRKFFQLRKTASFDLLHATSWRVAVPATAILRQSAVITVHGREVFVVPSYLRTLMNHTLRRAKSVVVVSKPIGDKLQASLGFNLPNLLVSWNGVSFPEIAFTSDSTPQQGRILCLCRLVERKNLECAVAAVARLHAEGFDLSFHIAGSGPMGDSIDAAIAEAGAGDYISRLGFIDTPEAIREYQKAEYFLHPQIATESGSDLEGFGISIADAMSFGCITIAGNSGGPADFITDGKTGYLVDGRTVNDIADKLRELISNPNLAHDVAEAGRSFAKAELTWASHVQKVLGEI